MSSILLQAAGRAHYEATVESPVSLDVILGHLASKEKEEVREAFPQGEAAVWGLMPNNTGSTATTWSRLEPGDLVLFSGRGQILSVGEIGYKTRSAPLARELWGARMGRTWEYLFLLRSVRDLGIPYKAFNKVAGYKPNYAVQSAFILKPHQVEALEQAFDIRE